MHLHAPDINFEKLIDMCFGILNTYRKSSAEHTKENKNKKKTKLKLNKKKLQSQNVINIPIGIVLIISYRSDRLLLFNVIRHVEIK